MAGVRFDAACVTNVSRDHLDYHPTIQDYRLAKSKLFDHLAPEGFAVVNADDPMAAGYLGRFDGPALTVGIRSAAEITATPLEQFPSEQTFLLTAGSETMPVRTRMIGPHHVYNCLTAAAVGLAYGIDLPTVVRGLEAVRYVPGRLERIECGQPFGVFVDFAHTPDALAACLQALRQVTAGRLICVFGAGGDRDRQKRPLMGRAVEHGADLAVVTSDNPRSEDPRAIADESSRLREPGSRARDPRSRRGHPLGPGRGQARRLRAPGRQGARDEPDHRPAADPAGRRRMARRWLYEEGARIPGISKRCPAPDSQVLILLPCPR